MASIDQYWLALQQIPWKLIIYLGLEFGGVGGALIIWWWRVFKHPINCWVKTKMGSWRKRASKIVNNIDGTRYLKFLGDKVEIPCPDLKYFEPVSTLFFFRQKTIHMKEDGVGQLHPFMVNDFTKEFVPESVNNKFFYVNMAKRNADMYSPVKTWVMTNFGTIASFVGLVVVVVMLIAVTSNIKDMVIHASDVIGNGMTSLASALSTNQLPVPLQHAPPIVPGGP